MARTTEQIVAGAERARAVLDKLSAHEHPELEERTLYRYCFRSEAHPQWRYRTYTRMYDASTRLARGRREWPDGDHKVQTIRVIGDWQDRSW